MAATTRSSGTATNTSMPCCIAGHATLDGVPQWRPAIREKWAPAGTVTIRPVATDASTQAAPAGSTFASAGRGARGRPGCRQCWRAAAASAATPVWISPRRSGAAPAAASCSLIGGGGRVEAEPLGEARVVGREQHRVHPGLPPAAHRSRPFVID